jgi:hypothetical protein
MLALPGHLPAAGLLAWAAAAAASPLECQPRAGRHVHTPLFHIVGRMLRTADGDYWPLGATDGNAVFGHSGIFHVMHQTPNRTSTAPVHPTAGYWASWGHVVSDDLAHFRRIENALNPNFTSSYDWHDGDCDGTVSFVPPHTLRGGVVMTFGPDCARGVSTEASRRDHDGEGDAPRVGIARLTGPAGGPDDTRLLSRWTKDPANPIVFAPGSPPCAFSGKLWQQEAGGNWSMICAVNSLNNAWARYTTADQSLHGPWHLADPSFATFMATTLPGLGPVPPARHLAPSAPFRLPPSSRWPRRTTTRGVPPLRAAATAAIPRT